MRNRLTNLYFQNLYFKVAINLNITLLQKYCHERLNSLAFKILVVKMVLKIKIMKIADVKTPSYAHKGDSGVDLYSAEDCTLKPMERKLISTGIRIAIPYGYEAQVRPKSGLAVEHGISHANSVGTIDAGYRGEIKVPLINLGDKPYRIGRGKKIGQMVFAKVEEAVFEEVNELDITARGEGGFGSTGTD